jgi:hypothetical protein
VDGLYVGKNIKSLSLILAVLGGVVVAFLVVYFTFMQVSKMDALFVTPFIS